jgi:hypothetical protein
MAEQIVRLEDHHGLLRKEPRRGTTSFLKPRPHRLDRIGSRFDGQLKPGLRKFALAAHLTFSVGWIGTVIAYLALGVSAVTSADDQTIRAAWTAMEVTGWYVIVPLALTSLLTGLVMALGTKWGLFRYYWVSISFVLTVFSTVILLLHMPSVTASAELAQHAEGAALEALGGDLGHPGIGLVILLVVQVLNIYKPPGLTRYGWRRQQAERSSSAA